MAAHPIVVVDEEVLARIPEEFRSDPRFQKGARLELVPVASGSVDGQMGDWRRLRGIFKNIPVNLNDELEKDRLLENALNERMIRGCAR